MPPRNPFFTGREDILATLHSTLQDGAAALAQPPAISGLGGIGKTQTAIEYAHRYGNEYQAVLWVSAETEAEVISGFAALARLLDLPEKDKTEQDQVINAVKNWLVTKENWLLILDNADDLPMVRQFVPPNVNGHIIYTTRASAMGKLARKILVNKFSHEDGAALLLKRAVRESSPNSPEWDHALAFSREVDGLPLALDQAGAYIEENNLSVKRYIELYDAEGIRLLAQYGSLGDDDHAPVTVTFSLAYQQVVKRHPAAADFFRLCSFLGPDNIPEELFTDNPDALEEKLSLVASDKRSWSEFIGTVCSHSLITHNYEDSSFCIHRIVQAVLINNLKVEECVSYILQVTPLLAVSFPTSDFTNWVDCERLLSHAFTSLKHAEVFGAISHSVALLSGQIGMYLLRRGKYNEIEPLLKKSLIICEKQLGSNDVNTVAALHNLGHLYWKQGQYEFAEPLVKQALTISETQLGADHPDVAHGLNNLAILYQIQEKHDEATTLLQRALSISESKNGDKHPHTINALSNLANCYLKQKMLNEAQPLLERVLEIREDLLGSGHPNTTDAVHNLAGLHMEKGNYSEAEQLLKRALVSYELLLGQGHPDTINAVNTLAGNYLKQKRLKEAEPLFERVSVANETIWGAGHPKAINSKKNYLDLKSLIEKRNR